jgi:hypothetical protein
LVDTVTSLAMAAQGGDRAALHGFVRATQADVWRLCAHLADPASADDLTQETYARAMASLAKFRGEASARTWLLAIARPAPGRGHGSAPRRSNAATIVRAGRLGVTGGGSRATG